jgi:hypothetical protein
MTNMSEMSAMNRIQYNRENAVAPVDYLQEAGAIRPTDDETELAFTDSFETRVHEHIERVERPTESDVARIYSVDEADVSEMDRDYTAYKVIHTVYNWASESALVFDIAADRALREVTDWESAVPPKQRARMLKSLRSFQDACFFCGGEIIFNSEETAKSCCADMWVLTLHCGDCDRRFLEFSTEERGTADAGLGGVGT